MIIELVGPPASGKSTVSEEVIKEVNAEFFPSALLSRNDVEQQVNKFFRSHIGDDSSFDHIIRRFREALSKTALELFFQDEEVLTEGLRAALISLAGRNRNLFRQRVERLTYSCSIESASTNRHRPVLLEEGIVQFILSTRACQLGYFPDLAGDLGFWKGMESLVERRRMVVLVDDPVLAERRYGERKKGRPVVAEFANTTVWFQCYRTALNEFLECFQKTKEIWIVNSTDLEEKKRSVLQLARSCVKEYMTHNIVPFK